MRKRQFFLKTTIDSAENHTLDILCDTYTGIVINVNKYGEIGEMIEGDFTADNCNGLSFVREASGTFKVVREQ